MKCLFSMSSLLLAMKTPWMGVVATAAAAAAAPSTTTTTTTTSLEDSNHIEATQQRHRSLVSLKQAKEACAHVKSPSNRELCIDDVLMTDDLGIADMWS